MGLRGDKTAATIPSGGFHGTLVANTTKTVTLSGDPVYIEVMNRSGSAEIYFIIQHLTDAATPSIAGDGTFVLPASISSLKIDLPTVDSSVRVLMISTGTPTYSITPFYS